MLFIEGVPRVRLERIGTYVWPHFAPCPLSIRGEGIEMIYLIVVEHL